MVAKIKHAKTNTVPDWSQADLDAAIAAGTVPPGTTLAGFTLASDWNADHVIDATGVTDGYVLTANGGTADFAPATGGSTPAGSDMQIQFNDAGVFGADPNFDYDKITGRLTVGATSGEFKITSEGSDANGLGIITNQASGAGAGAGIQAFTRSIPTNVDHRLAFYTFGYLNGTTKRNSASIEGVATQAWVDGTAQGTAITFETTSNGSGARTERMRIDHNGNVGIKTTAPTHALTFSSTANGFADYNTVDQVTNYERARGFWSGSVYNMFSEASGTGTLRAIKFGSSSRNITVNNGGSISGIINVSCGSIGSGTTGFGAIVTLGATTTVAQNALAVLPTVSQSAGASYRAIWVSPWEQTVGSGAKLLLDLGTNSAADGGGTHTSRFSVTNTGGTTVGGSLSVVSGTTTLAALVMSATTIATSVGATGTNVKINAYTNNDNVTAASGTVASVSSTGIGIPTFNAANTGVTYTTASTLYVAGPPVAGTNVTIPNRYSLNIATGTSYFGGMIQLAPNASPTYMQGGLVYDSTNDCFTAYNSSSAVALQIGQEEWVRVVNNTGSTIGNGVPVYINGASGGMATIALARADALTTATCIGLTTESIANGATGRVTNLGLVRNMDTSAFVVGPVYLSPTTAGTLTQTAPTNPNWIVKVGDVTSVNATTGVVQVTQQTPISTATGGSGGVTQNIQNFTASGTWTKPAGAKLVRVILVGGGGGGGSGGNAALLSVISGGSGGQPGSVADVILSADQLGATETVTIGAGGTGGAGVAVNSNGTNGASGGSTFFGGTTVANSKVVAPGSFGGFGGSSSGATGRAGIPQGSVQNISGLNYLVQNYIQAAGAGPSSGLGGAANDAFYGPGPGGGAAGISVSDQDSAAVSSRRGGAGGAGSNVSGAMLSSGFGGGGAQPTISTNGAAGGAGAAGSATYNTTLALFGAGGGGGNTGSGASSTVNGGAGGNGGANGGGGGGGGPCRNGATSGKGGDGGAGAAFIITYY